MELVTIIIVCFFLLCVCAAYLTVKTDNKYYIKWLMIPCIIALGLIFFIKLPDIEGYPVQSYPKGDFLLQGYKESTIEGKKELEIWVNDKGSKQSRLYGIPYDKGIEQQLEQMMQGNAQGMPRIGHFNKIGKGKPAGNNYGWDPYQLDLHDFPASRLPDKNLGY